MKAYNHSQFKQMVKRYKNEYGKTDICNWSDYYQTMQNTLRDLKSQNKLDEEKIETETILEYCQQYGNNSNVKTSISVVSFVYSLIAVFLTIFSESNSVKFIEDIYSLIIFITFLTLIILFVILMSFKSSRRIKNDIIYYKIKLNIIKDIASK